MLIAAAPVVCVTERGEWGIVISLFTGQKGNALTKRDATKEIRKGEKRGTRYIPFVEAQLRNSQECRVALAICRQKFACNRFYTYQKNPDEYCQSCLARSRLRVW